MKNSANGEVDSFYAIRPECQSDVPKIRFKPRAGKTLSARRWHAAFSQDGHLDIEKVLRRIQRGGVHPSIKGVVWEFLLGCFDPNSTFDERNELRQQRRQQYGALKAECQKMAPVIGSGKFITTPIVTVDGRPVQDLSTNDNSQDDNRATSTPSPLDSPLDDGGHVDDDVPDKKVIQWKLMLHQIGLDVVRTDRTLVFYESEANQAKLWDVLAVYAWMDNDIGYCQGMNDICSPMVILVENEADAFWCFERAMRRLVWGFVPTSVEGVLGGFLTVYQLQLIERENFRVSTNSIGVQSQLGTLSEIIKAVDPQLHQHLEDLDGGEYLFAFRMLMVLFRREFSFVDALYLWELMWAMEYNPNIFSSYEESSASADKSSTQNTNGKMLKKCGKFERKNVKTGYKNQHSSLAVFLVASVLATKNKRFLKEAKGLDDVVKILGDITGNLDAKKACNEALKLHKKYLSKAKKS